jgi:hypothetical protein
MQLRSTSQPLNCSVCNDEITDIGYLAATVSKDEYKPNPQDAVCNACGFNQIGMMGCAPELADVTDFDSDSDSGSDQTPEQTLLHVRMTDNGISVISDKQ